MIDGGGEHLVVARVAVGIEAVPHRHWHAEEPLTADEPVAVQAAHPVVVAVLHVARVPGEFVAAFEQFGAQGCVAATVADVPLPGGDDFERPSTTFVELHRVGDGACVAEHLARCGEHVDDALLGLLGGEAGEFAVVGATLGRFDPRRGLGGETPVEADEGPRRQVQFAPPGDVGDIAERTDHGDTGALVGVGQGVGQHRHFDLEERGAHRGAEQRLITLVVGVSHHGHATRQQLGAGGVDE